MRIVLIGASGFFGRYLLRALIDDRHHCVVLTRTAVRSSEIGFHSLDRCCGMYNNVEGRSSAKASLRSRCVMTPLGAGCQERGLGLGSFFRCIADVVVRID